MQHWPSAESDISSASQDNPGTSWNHKIHHRVQKSQPIMTILSQLNHGQKLQYYFCKINSNIILPSAPRSFRWAPSLRFPKQNDLCIFFLLVRATLLPPHFFLHFINTDNIWSGTKVMNIFVKQIFTASDHFLRVRRKYFPHHPLLEYLQPLFVRQLGRPSFTPICNISCNTTSLIKSSST